MLSIRMQRLGRKGHSMYRIVVQDSRCTPTSGKYVALLGSYDPHTKVSSITKDKAELYLKNGAQPSDRVVKLFKSEKISLPKWVADPAKQKREIRNPDKLRRNRPAEEKVAEPSEEVSAQEPAKEDIKAEDQVAGEPATTQPEEQSTETDDTPSKDVDEVESDNQDKTEPDEDTEPKNA